MTEMVSEKTIMAAVSLENFGSLRAPIAFVEGDRPLKVGHRQVDENHLGHRVFPSWMTRFALPFSGAQSYLTTMELEKITDSRTNRAKKGDTTMPARRRTGMDLIGERWSMPGDPRTDARAAPFRRPQSEPPGISANVLTQRLERAGGAGVLIRRKLPPPASVQVYELTPWGLRRRRSSRRSAAGRCARRSTIRRCRSARCR